VRTQEIESTERLCVFKINRRKETSTSTFYYFRKKNIRALSFTLTNLQLQN